MTDLASQLLVELLSRTEMSGIKAKGCENAFFHVVIGLQAASNPNGMC